MVRIATPRCWVGSRDRQGRAISYRYWPAMRSCERRRRESLRSPTTPARSAPLTPRRQRGRKNGVPSKRANNGGMGQTHHRRRYLARLLHPELLRKSPEGGVLATARRTRPGTSGPGDCWDSARVDPAHATAVCDPAYVTITSRVPVCLRTGSPPFSCTSTLSGICPKRNKKMRGAPSRRVYMETLRAPRRNAL